MVSNWISPTARWTWAKFSLIGKYAIDIPQLSIRYERVDLVEPPCANWGWCVGGGLCWPDMVKTESIFLSAYQQYILRYGPRSRTQHRFKESEISPKVWESPHGSLRLSMKLATGELIMWLSACFTYLTRCMKTMLKLQLLPDICTQLQIFSWNYPKGLNGRTQMSDSAALDFLPSSSCQVQSLNPSEF